MKTSINLLPGEVGVKTNIATVNESLKKIATGFVAVFVIIGVAAVAYILFLSNTLERVRATNEQISSSIKQLEVVETRFIAVRDRVQKAQSILAEKSAGDNVSVFSALTLHLPGSVKLVESKVTKDEMEVSFAVSNSSDISSIFAKFGKDTSFEKVILSNLSYNPSLGYVVKLNIFLK